jgi:gluconolactonase
MVTSLCFGGDDMRDLYVVTGSRGGPSENCGSIFRCGPTSRASSLPPAKVKV